MKCKIPDCDNSHRSGFRLFRHNGEYFCWLHLPKVTKDRLPKYKDPNKRPLTTAEAKQDTLQRDS